MQGNTIQIEPGFFSGQMVGVLAGLFMLLLGAAILYTIGYWRRHALLVEGEIIGIRRAGAYFHTVYRYALPAGGWSEATSVQGSTILKGRATGSRLKIRVMADHPNEAREVHAPATWAVALVLLLSGGWLTYYSVTMWKRSPFTWILFALAALFVGRKLWRRLTPYLTKMRAQPAASNAWSEFPIETAETLGLSPQPTRFQVRSANPVRSAVILFFVGLLILATAYIPVHRLLLLPSGTRAEGTVLQLYRAASHKDNHPGLYPVVQFTSTDGTLVRFMDGAGANPSPYKVGDHVPVMYKPGKQHTAMIDRGIRNWVPVALMLLLGTVLAAFGFMSLRAAFWVGKPQQRLHQSRV